MAQNKDIRLESFETLLDDFRQLPGRVKRPRTFMEIAGYPHYENACSNVLAFFMDPEESHGLGTLVLDALVSAVGNTDAEGVGGNVSVEREVVTEAGNRIDILITSDEQAILIENKIYAWADNPFDDYGTYLERRILDGRVKHKILLTMYPADEGSQWDFTNLTYEQFVEQIRSLLGLYASTADTRYLTMFLDFLNTLENLRKGSRMDQEFVKLLAERSDDVREFFNDLSSLRDELRDKVKGLQPLIASQYPIVEEEGLWRGDTVAMSDNLYYKIRVAQDLLVGIDTRISPHGWEIQIFARDRGDPSKLREILNHLGIPFEERERLVHPNLETGRFIHQHFAYNEKLNRIRSVLQNLIDKLATSQERELKS